MSRIHSRLIRFGLAFLFSFALNSGAALAEEPRTPWLEPIRSTAIEIGNYEEQSSSPFGGSRLGGTDDRSFALLPDASALITQDAGKWQLEIWDAASGKSLGKFGPIQEPVAIAAAPDGDSLISASFDSHAGGAVELWNVRSRSRTKSLDCGVNLDLFSAIAVSADGKTLALATRPIRRVEKPEIHFWDLQTGEELLCWKEVPKSAPPRRASAQRQTLERTSAAPFGPITFVPDGRSLAMVIDRDVVLFEVGSGQVRFVLERLPILDHVPDYQTRPLANAIAVSPDGALCAVGCVDGIIRLYGLPDGERLLPLIGHSGAVEAVQFVANNRLASFGRDNQLLQWEINSLEPFSDFPLTPLTEFEFEGLWKAACGDEVLARNRALFQLAARPDSAGFLRTRVAPADKADANKVAALVEQLSNENYNERRRAAVELRKHKDLAVPALSKSGGNDVVSQIRVELERELVAESRPALRAMAILQLQREKSARSFLEELSAGAEESVLTSHAASALKFWAVNSTEATAPAEDLWRDLAAEDASVAWRAILQLRRLTDGPAFLRARLESDAQQREADYHPRRVAQLIAQLASDDYPVREESMKSLAALGRSIEPIVRTALKEATEPESRQRLESLLNTAKAAPPKLDELRTSRAIESLEMTSAGRQFLDRIKEGEGPAGLRAAATNGLTFPRLAP